jgi:hypothetical protein
VAPKLDLSLLAVTNLKSTSATLNAQVAWPGANFSVKFCITDSPTSKNCLVTSTISIANENSGGTSANNAVTIARDISGLQANTQYFVLAAVMVGEDQFTTVASALRTPSTTPIALTTLKFALKRQVLTKAQKALLNSVVAKVQVLGFASIRVASPTHVTVKNYLEAKRIGATYEFLKRYFKNDKNVKLTLVRVRTKTSFIQNGKDVAKKHRNVTVAVR